MRPGVLVVFAAAGGAAWWLSRQANAANLYMPVDLTAAAGIGSADAAGFDYLTPATADGSDYAGGYLAALSLAEDPRQDPLAKNPYSSASGLFQFVRKTWTALGGDWGTDPSQAFGGLSPSADEQMARALALTNSNAAALQSAGLAVDNVSLYAMHFTGSLSKSKALLTADASTPLSAIIGATAAADNPAMGSTAGSARRYLQAKVGG